ncbi:DNA methyltransferase [Pleurocapsa sp. FMAR1]|uniref:DNA methyltransferase n=1 Tax=Pleurocapsa sp. FMAR1 TaxID=3040204 RepID=UPI0029C98B58|nr:DNA methyltransferase [Pleurocapsa sp. FMAR1]
MVATPQSLNEFVNYRLQYISGKERSQAQLFLDRFFQAFGHQGALQAGAEYEVAIKKGSKKGKTGFADLVWKPRVLIEMKTQGEDLGKHYRQAFNYWTRIVPNRPRYVMLCNFDQFWIYDFDNQVDEPVDVIELLKLPERASAFGFMGLEEKNSIFQNNQVEVTKETARKMGELCEILKQRGKREGFDTLAAQRLVLQCVLAMFAEDRGLLPQDMFISCIQDCLKGKSSYDVLGGLFQEMNRPGIAPAGQYKGVDYFNGGLFATIHPIELTKEELNYLDAAAREDWKQIRPAIFGNIFEGTANQKERHAHGMHFTSEADIMKIVKPTISNYWEAKIEAANTIAELNSLQLELQNYRVLDPACGSGNFLYLAYQELKEIEKSLLDKISDRRRSETGKQQTQIGLVTPLQFYGMDINPFAVELAKVTLTIAKKVAIDKLSLTERELPLDTLDNNIVCQDALFTSWVKADAIIGNPPFLGGKNIRRDLGDEYVEKVFKQFPNVKDVDFCSYWFRLAHDNICRGDSRIALTSETALTPAGRVGLVGTNSISQGKSRKATLDYVTNEGGHIHEAISTQPWSGEAKVHVSIVNWSFVQPKRYFLDDREVNFINSSLQPHIDVSSAKTLQANKNKCFQGVIPVGKDFIVTEEQVKEWIAKDSKNEQVLKLFSMGSNLAQNVNGKPDRWIIDFSNMDLENANDYKLPLEHLKIYVKPERQKNREAVMREKWWRYKRTNEAMRKAIAPLSYYFTVPRVSKWAVFLPAPLNWLPGDKSVVVASEDYYVLGILLSNVHRLWMEAKKSTLKADIAYTHQTCFETFPFPQTPCKGERPFAPTDNIIQQIRAKTLELHEYRTQQMEKKQWGITKLYNEYFHEPASKLYQLHQQLDKLVMQAYNFKADDNILEKLLELNLELAEKEKQGKIVIGAESLFVNKID